MAIRTIAVVAAVSAAAGAAVTSAFFSLSGSSGSKDRSSKSSATSTKAADGQPSRTFPPPPAPAPASSSATGGNAHHYYSSSTFPPSSSSSSTASSYNNIAPVSPGGLFQHGFPGPQSDLRITPSLISSFDRRTRNPHWVVEHITPSSLGNPNADRKHSIFTEDDSIPSAFRAKLTDYARSGYDRGHQVPAADAKWSQEAMDATFSLSNICPQVGDGFNRDYWAHFEDFCRRLTTTYDSVRIVTGPLYLPRRDPDGKWRVHYEVIGSPPNVAVPTHFFKAIFAEKGGVNDPAKGQGPVAIGAFVLPNARIANDEPLSAFEVPLEILERSSGLEFVKKLAPEKRRSLCKEVHCSIIVKDYLSRQPR